MTILTSGTLGDVYPAVALGVGLRTAGYRVRIATHPPFAPLVRERGLEFSPVEGNPSELLLAPHGQDALVYGGSLVRSAAATWRYLREARVVFGRLLESAWQACRGSGALIVALPTLWGTQIAERLEIPCCLAPLQPLSRSGAFPSPLLPFTGSLGPAYNRLTHRFVERLTWQPWRPALDRWRAQVLGLARLPREGPFVAIYAQAMPFVYGFSPLAVPRPSDWPPQHQIAGYWFLDRLPGWRPPAVLADFLAGGPPPVVVSFSSLSQRRLRSTAAIIAAALERSGKRGVLLAPPTAEVRSLLGQRAIVVEGAPHDWLFPQAAAVVHHGGAGSTGAGLRAGVPAVAAPLGIDQFFWGQRVAALGVGPPPIPLRSLTAERLAQAIVAASGDAGMRWRAAHLGARIRAEDGVARAVELLEPYLNGL